MITINDIAKGAGVAKSTVSRYLNNGSVSENTKKKIQAVIEETGYKPNAFARSLKAQKTNILGVIIPRLDSPSANDVLAGGIDRSAHDQGYQLIITNADQQKDREIENIRTLAKQRVEGIMMLAREITDDHIQVIKEVDVPLLILGQQVDGIHSMIHADYEAGKKMGEYALELGHEHFLFVGVSEKDEAVGVSRKRGFINAVKVNKKIVLEEVMTSFSRAKTYKNALEFLPKYQDSTYIACATDNIAVAVLKAANELGYKVPEDFSLSGFGGYEATNYVYPTITTVRYPYKKMGVEAINNLKKLINGEEVPLIIELPNKLLINNSTTPNK
ncbi:LacI family transcriptional regulator [Tetragenococcus halophilus]|uniref:LacI family transcriptional regulator n=1 Tax=Tetragenococcus halophilus TaxID=51669 RepID=A0A3G5FIH8_TETHA|nr:LacI family DNA-binding transcriptional regulator [Tetragenococcus halophilus]AYW50156.1 LacI family transcriptional regulator [Tetragenococcus halophilus]GBD64581.1 Sucrose operon repressor [Tetragenococcus halophilus subsp. flandriensis]